MIKLYKSVLFTFGVFILGLLMHFLRQDVAVSIERVLPLLLLYGIGIALGLLMKPIVE